MSEITNAAKAVDDQMQADHSVRLSRFDPSWLAVIIPIIIDVIKNCREQNNANEFRRAARAGNGWFSRWFGAGRRARKTVSSVVDLHVSGAGQSGRNLRKAQNQIVDAMLAVGSRATSSQLQKCVKEATESGT